MSENKGIAGLFVMGEGLQQHEQSIWPFTSEADLRAFIAAEVAKQVPAEVMKALDALVDELRQSKAFQPVTAQHTPSGTCWACGEYGKREDMMWQGHHLIHATVECRDAAEMKPETREHRG